MMPVQAYNASFVTRLQRAYQQFVRWGFARFYREFAWTYDTVAALVSGGQWANWGRAALPFLAGHTLELGCGTGTLQRTLASTGHSAIGLDASPQMLKRTRNKLCQAGLPLRLVRGVAQSLPFSSASFDTIVATFPTEYILDPATVGELERVLRPGGRAVIVLAATFGHDGMYQRVLDLLYRLTLQRSPRQPAGPAPESMLGRALQAQGLAVREQWVPLDSHAIHLVLAEGSG